MECNEATDKIDTTYCSDDDDTAGIGRDGHADYEENVDGVKVMYYENANS